ncbi:MAG TPA: hypothetical protein VIN59_01790 [Alphaproteobacteria bacterium]
MKLPLWVWITIAAFAAGGLFAYALNQPNYAGWRYGACKVFLEHSLRFPPTTKIFLGGEQILNDRQSKAGVAFSAINTYGSQQVKMFECYYDIGANGAPILTKIMVEDDPMDPKKVAEFNKMLPIILTQKLDTALPKDIPTDLEDVHE